MAEKKEGCVEPAAGPLSEEASAAGQEPMPPMETKFMTFARVGHPAPDFEANVFFQGGFRTLKLSDYLGRWIVLCFYPGDFTFV